MNYFGRILAALGLAVAATGCFDKQHVYCTATKTSDDRPLLIVEPEYMGLGSDDLRYESAGFGRRLTTYSQSVLDGNMRVETDFHIVDSPKQKFASRNIPGVLDSAVLRSSERAKKLQKEFEGLLKRCEYTADTTNHKTRGN